MGLFTIRNKKQYKRKVGRKRKSYVPKTRTERKKQKRNTTNKVIVEEDELMSREQLRKKLKNRNSSINVSGKRKSKMLKRLRHTIRESAEKEEVDVEMAEEPKGKRKIKKTKPTSESMDVE